MQEQRGIWLRHPKGCISSAQAGIGPYLSANGIQGKDQLRASGDRSFVSGYVSFITAISSAQAGIGPEMTIEIISATNQLRASGDKSQKRSGRVFIQPLTPRKRG